jgi:hypothetical protein
VLRGDFVIEEREALRVRFRRAQDYEVRGLEDAVVTKAALARMLVVKCHQQEPSPRTRGRLIVATPTGSTAYNLSAADPSSIARARSSSRRSPHTELSAGGGPWSVTIKVTLRSMTRKPT